MSDRPAWDDPQRPGDDQPADDAWAAPGPTEPDPTEPVAAAPAQTEPPPPGERPAGPEVTSPLGGPPPLPPPPGEPPADRDHVRIGGRLAGWLRQVAAQVEPRLDRVSPSWRLAAQAGAARACAFGLLLGYLARLYPHARTDLARAAEAHPSYSTLPSGSRLQTLEQISADMQRMAAWLGPLVEVSDPRRMQALLD